MRYFLLWFLSLMFVMMSLSFPKTVRSQTSVLISQSIDDDDDDNDGQDSNSSQTSSGNVLNLFLILNYCFIKIYNTK